MQIDQVARIGKIKRDHALLEREYDAFRASPSVEATSPAGDKIILGEKAREIETLLKRSAAR